MKPCEYKPVLKPWWRGVNTTRLHVGRRQVNNRSERRSQVTTDGLSLDSIHTNTNTKGEQQVLRNQRWMLDDHKPPGFEASCLLTANQQWHLVFLISLDLEYAKRFLEMALKRKKQRHQCEGRRQTTVTDINWKLTLTVTDTFVCEPPVFWCYYVSSSPTSGPLSLSFLVKPFSCDGHYPSHVWQTGWT